jgi:hypothetical protein
LSEWRTPAEMPAYVATTTVAMGSAFFFRQGGVEFLRDGWLAAEFGRQARIGAGCHPLQMAALMGLAREQSSPPAKDGDTTDHTLRRSADTLVLLDVLLAVYQMNTVRAWLIC